MKSDTVNQNALWANVKTVATILSVIGAFWGILWGATSFVDWRIKQVVTDENYMAKVAANVRPSAIFDSNNSIQVDSGAMKYIDRIEVFDRGTDPHTEIIGFPKTIRVTPKRYLTHAPIITTLNGLMTDVTEERGDGFTWTYHLSTPIHNMKTLPQSFLFRIEIIF